MLLIHIHAGRRVRSEAQGSAVIPGVAEARAPPCPGSTASTKPLIPIAKGLLCRWKTPLHPGSCFLFHLPGVLISAVNLLKRLLFQSLFKDEIKMVITRVKTQMRFAQLQKAIEMKNSESLPPRNHAPDPSFLASRFLNEGNRSTRPSVIAGCP